MRGVSSSSQSNLVWFVSGCLWNLSFNGITYENIHQSKYVQLHSTELEIDTARNMNGIYFKCYSVEYKLCACNTTELVESPFVWARDFKQANVLLNSHGPGTCQVYIFTTLWFYDSNLCHVSSKVYFWIMSYDCGVHACMGSIFMSVKNRNRICLCITYSC